MQLRLQLSELNEQATPFIFSHSNRTFKGNWGGKGRGGRHVGFIRGHRANNSGFVLNARPLKAYHYDGLVFNGCIIASNFGILPSERGSVPSDGNKVVVRCEDICIISQIRVILCRGRVGEVENLDVGEIYHPGRIGTGINNCAFAGFEGNTCRRNRREGTNSNIQ